VSKSKKLTLSNISKLNSELNERKVIRVCGDYEVQIDIKFRRTKIQKVILDYFTILQDLKKRENINDETIVHTTSLLYALIIRYFSDIPLPDIDDVEKLIQVSNSLLDLGIMEELFGENGFPKDQVELLTKEIDKAANGIGNILGELSLQSVLSEGVEENGEVVQ
jgi:hypothetical protein